jgi:UMF1 family MFS transporter
MVLYTINVAVSSGMTEAAGETQSKWIMLFAITFAVAGGFFWGRLTDGIGPRRTLNAVLIGWMGIFTLAALVGLVGLPLWCMYVVAGTAGFCLGGVWAADRPFMLRLTPPARIGEFYGLYGMVGRFSAILGPMIWASVTFLVNRILAGDAVVDPVRKAEIARTGQGFGVIVLLLMMGISIWILRKVSDEPRHWQDRNSKAASANSPI